MVGPAAAENTVADAGGKEPLPAGHVGVERPSPSGGAVALPQGQDAPPEPEPRGAAVAAGGPDASQSRAPAAATTAGRSGRETSAPPVPGLVAIGGAGGGAGCTTVAVSLATALGAVAPTCLVELCPQPGGVASLLRLDPVHNLSLVGHTVATAGVAGVEGRPSPIVPPSGNNGVGRPVAGQVRPVPAAGGWPGPAAPVWGRAIEQEAQPIGERSPLGWALCGPKRVGGGGLWGELWLARVLSPAFVEGLLAALRRRYRYVVADLGDLSLLDVLSRGESPGDEGTFRVDAGVAGAALATLRAADRLLLVTGGDLVSAGRARDTLLRLRELPGWRPERVGLVLNRYDPAYHFERWQLEEALGIGTAAVVPFDHAGAQRALQAQQAVVLDRRSRAGRALLGLADRLHGGRVRLPPDARDGAAGSGGAGMSPGISRTPQRLWAALRTAVGRSREADSPAGPGDDAPAAPARPESASMSTGGGPCEAGTTGADVETERRGGA